MLSLLGRAAKQRISNKIIVKKNRNLNVPSNFISNRPHPLKIVN